jgi:DNA-binding IclR family transcriptional regulator
MVAPRDSTATLMQTVERAISLLKCFTDAQPRVRVSTLAQQLNLNQSTVSRLLATMESLGFVERDPLTGLFGLGLEIVTLGGVAMNQIEIRRQAMTDLSIAATEFGLATNLAILRDDAIFYMARFEAPKTPKIYNMVGRHNPLHCTAMGKVLLAWLSETDREALLGRIPFPVFTPFTASSVDELRPMLDRVRARGYAVEREELAFGRACVAAAIQDAAGNVVAATSVSGPLSDLDLDNREAKLAEMVIEMADRVSNKLGFITVPTARLGSALVELNR